MPRPWNIIEAVDTPDGKLELRQRGERDFMISHAGRVLMTSAYHESEVIVAKLGCEPIKTRKKARVLIGGAGMGYTLRAALDVLPKDAQVTVAELNPVVLRWCQGPLALLTKDAVGDTRTTAKVADVMKVVPARQGPKQGWDAIVVDLYIGPDNERGGRRDPLYGDDALAAIYSSLNPGGVYAVWGEERSQPFEKRLGRAGFAVRTERTEGKGPHHVIFLAEKPADTGKTTAKSAVKTSPKARPQRRRR